MYCKQNQLEKLCKSSLNENGKHESTCCCISLNICLTEKKFRTKTKYIYRVYDWNTYQSCALRLLQIHRRVDTKILL